MDSQAVNSPDLHVPPPNMGSDGLIVEPEQGDGASEPSFSDTSDTVLVNPRDASSVSPTSQDVPSVGADDDEGALDEEWVQKAKAIVDQTKADPYQQSREISKVKANYLKTHYNKDIKVADDQAL
jgi:hypothetical protein